MKLDITHIRLDPDRLEPWAPYHTLLPSGVPIRTDVLASCDDTALLHEVFGAQANFPCMDELRDLYVKSAVETTQLINSIL